MASIKKKSSGGGGANWMDTYGDMVTLLLCFFVLLYSISTVDQKKWMIVVKSFNRDAIIKTEEPPGPVGSSTSTGGDGLPMTDVVESALDDLYQFLLDYQAQEESLGDIQVSRGDNYVFISFNDAIFFTGDSFVLRQQGKDILDGLIPALQEVGPYVDELKVLGHTAQAGAGPNPVPGDRRLASNRATEVVIYLQERLEEQIYPGRLVVESFGQWRNVADNDTEANKAKNRRVEMVITGQNRADILQDSYQKYLTMATQNIKTEYTTGNG